MTFMGKLNSYLSWVFLQLYGGMSQERHLLKFMKFFSNLSWVLIILWKNCNLFVEWDSKPHYKSCTLPIFFFVCVWVCQVAVWRTTFGWVLCSKFASFFSYKGVIRQGDTVCGKGRWCHSWANSEHCLERLCQAEEREGFKTASWALTKDL